MKFGSKQNQKERKLDKGWLEQGMLREDGRSAGVWRMARVWCDGGWLWVCGGGGGVEGLVQMKREEEEREK